MLPETTKAAASLRPRSRRIATTALLCLAYILGLVSVLAQIPILLAGSRLVNTDLDAPGPKRLLLSELAVASFDGILPDKDGKSYLVTLHLFLNSFGWEYPTASNKIQSAGIVTPSYDNTIYLPRDFKQIGKELGLQPSAWACFPPQYAETCENQFFALFRSQWPWDSPPGTLTHFIYYTSFAVAALVFAIEILIAVRPHWLKCRCYFSVLKRYCPCPRGERHEIERLPPAFWDRYRLWMWPLLPAYFGLAAFDLWFRGFMLLSWLRWAPKGDTSGLRPRMGTGFLALNWGIFGCSAAAAVCILIRLLLSRKGNWMEQQGALTETEASVGLDGAQGSSGEGRARGYTDAEADAPIADAVPAASVTK